MSMTLPPDVVALLAPLDETPADQAFRAIAADRLDEHAAVGCGCRDGWVSLPNETYPTLMVRCRNWPGCHDWTDLAALLRLMAKEERSPYYIEKAEHETPWAWARPDHEKAGAECCVISEAIMARFPEPTGEVQPTTEGDFGGVAFYRTRQRAELALFLAWKASGMPGSLR